MRGLVEDLRAKAELIRQGGGEPARAKHLARAEMMLEQAKSQVVYVEKGEA